jgi:hypothetical protein
LKAIQSEDRFDIFGKHVAHTLRGVDPRQVLVAEKLINDVLFEAQMGNLTQDITIQHRYQVPRGNVTASSSSAKGKASDQINFTANQINFEGLRTYFSLVKPDLLQS